jgi:hypothetical protein
MNQIGAKASSRDLRVLKTSLTGADFDGKDGFHLNNRQPGNERSRSRPGKNAVHVFRAGLPVVQLRQGTGVKKVVWQLALLPLGNHGIGKGPRDLGQGVPDVIPSDAITCGRGPFFRCEISGEVIVDYGRIGDGHGDLLHLFKRQRLQRLENAILEHGLKGSLHMPSV